METSVAGVFAAGDVRDVRAQNFVNAPYEFRRAALAKREYLKIG